MLSGRETLIMEIDVTLGCLWRLEKYRLITAELDLNLDPSTSVNNLS